MARAGGDTGRSAFPAWRRHHVAFLFPSPAFLRSLSFCGSFQSVLSAAGGLPFAVRETEAQGTSLLARGGAPEARARTLAITTCLSQHLVHVVSSSLMTGHHEPPQVGGQAQ